MTRTHMVSIALVALSFALAGCKGKRSSGDAGADAQAGAVTPTTAKAVDTFPSGNACIPVPDGGHAIERLLAPKVAAGGGGAAGGAGAGAGSGKPDCSNLVGHYIYCASENACRDIDSDSSNCGRCGHNCFMENSHLTLCKSGRCDCFEVEKDNNGGVCPM